MQCSTSTRARRESSVRETRFSKRERVGCEAKDGPVSGQRSRSTLKRGSWRTVLASLASS